MKSPVTLGLLFFCLCSLLPVSGAQTKPNKGRPLPYSDTDGYPVLSSIIIARTEKLKNGFVSVYHQTVSDKVLEGLEFSAQAAFLESGDTVFYLLRRTESGWQQAADIQKCGRIY
jgi:hypothetical protein